MAMLSTRAPSMLPSIKCSSCGDDIEISKMGDHQCRPSTRNQAPASKQDASRVKSSHFFNPSQLGSSNNKQTRAAPPRIDPSAANRPYARTDVYASNGSPTRSYQDARQNDGRPSRLQRPPSDHLAPNLDSPFPTFPTTPAVKTPNSAFASPMFFSGLKDVQPPAQSPARKPATLAPPPQQQRPPQSPGFQQSELDLNSPNFFSGLKAALPSQQAQPRPVSQQERDELKRDEFFTARKPSNASSRVQSRRQDSVGGNTYDSYGSKDFMPGRKPSQAEAGPSRPGRPSGQVDNFIASLKEDPVKSNNTNATSQRTNAARPRNPLPGLERPGLERSPSEPWQQTSREPNRLPERAATTNDLQSNMYMTKSSNNSNHTIRGQEAPSSDDQTLPASTYGQTKYDSHYSSHSNSSSTSSALSRESTFTAGVSTPPSDVSLATSFGNPSGYGSQSKGNAYLSQYNPYTPYAVDDVPPLPQKTYTTSPTEASVVSIYPPRSNSKDQAPERPTLARSATDASDVSLKPRHSCRGCSQPIVGKSVKASDGRLTGRYHRACFVCTTCRAPFTSAQVYVLHDAPYCEYHYHALNGSLCAACDSGIEGQYRETDKQEKLHPRCLTCRTCRQVLADEYFEVNNTVYCERHALAEVRRLAVPGPGYGLAPPSGTLRAERRMTRLGMM